MVMGDSGIFNKAHIAKEKTRNAENDEKIKLAVLASKDKDGNIDNNKFEKELEEYGITDYTKDEENVIIKIISLNPYKKKIRINPSGNYPDLEVANSLHLCWLRFRSVPFNL